MTQEASIFLKFQLDNLNFSTWPVSYEYLTPYFQARPRLDPPDRGSSLDNCCKK
jgi:hypothetical protein